MRMWWVIGGVACSGGAGTTDSGVPQSQQFVVSNSGNSEREGHTPRGFQGQGGGLFVGDNLNAGFPEGDGVQVFLSFNIGRSIDNALFEGAWTIDAAEIAAADEPQIDGTPFDDLGDLVADEVIFDTFSSELWDLEPPSGAASCVLATGPAANYACDLAGAVQRAITDGRRWVNVRLQFEIAGDSDGAQDMVFFFGDDINATEPELFWLTIDATPAN